MKPITAKRKEWHQAIQQGLTPAQIAEAEQVQEAVVVHTLRHHTPKIKGAIYTHLKIPIPQADVIEAYYANTMKELASEYGVTVQTLKGRLPEDLKKTRKTYVRKVDKTTEEDKTEAVNAYYQSGRKLNCTEFTPNLMKQILDESGVSNKQPCPISSKYVVRLMDTLLSSQHSLEAITEPSSLLKMQRLIVNFQSDEPQMWKGQILDLMLSGELDQSQTKEISRAIDRVARFIGYED